jgi:malate/lactate dehydrogenase
MSTVAIIGAGDLGGATAQALAACDRIGRVVLIDAAADVAAGKALDILQSGGVAAGFRTTLTSTDDLTRVTGAAVCVIADRFGGAASEWEGEEGLAMLCRLVPYLSGVPLVFAGALQTELMLRAAREAAVAGKRLIGSAPEAFASALRAIVALEAKCSPKDVMLATLGSPPFVVPWSEASIGGYALERVLSQVQITRLEARAARLWPPGPYTLGVAAARAAEAIVTSARDRLSVLTLLGGEFGVRNRIGAVPVLLNKHGVADVRVPALNTRERVLLETSLGGP